MLATFLLKMGSLIGSALEILPHEFKLYLLLVATILVWSLHFLLRHVINRIETNTE